MSKLDKKTVDYVAKLARINLAGDEKEFFSQQLSKILGYIDKLGQLDTEGVEPMRSLHSSRDVLRQDCSRDSGCQQQILENAPDQEGGYFKIPKVLE